MARLRWWIGAVLLVCAGVAFTYIPPRSSPVFIRRYGPVPLPPYRYRVMQLADAWRSAALELRLREYRERLRPELERRRALEIPGPAVLLDWPAVPDSVSRPLLARLDRAWQDLGLGVSKISVGVVVALDVRSADPTTPSDPLPPVAYLLPDSTDRSTCIVYATSKRGSRSTPNLGPCAYYAAFGAPGREIARWSSGRDYDLALWASWTRGTGLPGLDSFFIRNDARFWFQPNAVACLAGRTQGCQTAVVSVPPESFHASRVVTVDQRWRPPALAGGAHYLADVVRSVGRERFQHFWNSELPVDTALAEALRMPVGEWTARWQTRLVPPIQLGAAPSAGSALLGILLAVGAIGMVLRTVARREVR